MCFVSPRMRAKQGLPPLGQQQRQRLSDEDALALASSGSFFGGVLGRGILKRRSLIGGS